MPIYEIQHAISLTPAQKDALAAKITTIHSDTFTTPKLFVQIYYTDVADRCTYISGKRSSDNHIRGQVRSGPSRTQQDWDNLCREISDAWEEVVIKPSAEGVNGDTNGHALVADPDLKLRSVILMGGMVAGLEAGFVLPGAGGDVQWLRKNWGEFQRLAQEGDEEFVGLVQEVKERKLLEKEADGEKSAVKRLEEMLGWGDSA